MKKIIIFGFPHCGTTILRTIIGHSENIEEVKTETPKIDTHRNDKIYLCKYPFQSDEFFAPNYNEYFKIFLLRNPLFVFSSLNSRFFNKIPKDHSIQRYDEILQKFIHYRENFRCDVRTIKYEEFFINNFENIKSILDYIDIKYSDSIFDNNLHNNTLYDLKIPANKPKPHKHVDYRIWQINQPFICNNTLSDINLSYEQMEQIMNIKNINIVYPEIIPIISEIKDK